MPPTLRRRILAGYGLVLGLLAVVLTASLVAFARIGRSSETLIRENYRSIRAADGMIDALERQDSGILLHFLGAAEAENQIRTNQAAFDGWLARAGATLTIEGEADLVADIREAATTYASRLDEAIASPPAEDAAARALYRERLLPAFLEARQAADALRDLNQGAMAAGADRDRDDSRSGAAALALLGGGALLFGMALSLLLSNRLAAPVRRLEAAARRVATGDYDAEVPEGPGDELGHLSTAFNEMASALRTYRALESERALQAQRRSAAVVQAIVDGVVVVDARLTILDLNPVGAGVLGSTPGAARGRPLDEIAPNATFLPALGNAAAGRTGASAEAGVVAAAEHEYETIVTPMSGPSGTPLGAVLLLRDVTQLRHFDRLKSEFVATASHELRTPITSLGMSVGMLEERVADRLGQPERALLAAAAEDVGRLRALADDLLDLSRIEAGRLDLAPVPIAPAALAFEAEAAFAAPAAASGLSLTTHIADGLPEVLADAERVRRVLANLLANAIRHTPRGGRVAIRAVLQDDAVRFEVEDTGEGIAEEDHARIFGRFAQVHGSRAAGGSGLGLTLAKELVEAHGGTIGISSSPGAGSVFWFTLPATT